MTAFFIFTAIVQNFATSLGVGSSTLAILNFFSAIADGTIDPTERRMMGIVYVVLRIAMVAILASTILLICMTYGPGEYMAMPAFYFAQITVLCALFTNALLMTAHLIPSTFGPSIQAGSWYALGTLSALAMIDMTDFTYTTFMLGYLAWIVLVTGIVNGVMAWMKEKQAKQPTQNA